MSWSKELPKESGFYWWREEPTDFPQVVEFSDMDTVYKCGTEIPMWTGEQDEDSCCALRGEFWPVKLTPP